MSSGPASRLGIGLAAVARPAYINAGRERDLGADRSPEQLRARTEELLDAAYAGGIRYVDVARSYGRAEEFLAGWLRRRAVEDVEVGSKWGYDYVGDWRLDADVHEVKDHSRATFARQLEQTRALLQDRLAVYHVHSATVETGVLEDRRLHQDLARLRDEGVRVGISTSGPEQAAAVRRALEVRVGGQPLFTSIQSTWNLLEPSAGPALAEAAEAGARVVVKEALANGRLTDARDLDDRAAARAAALAADLSTGLDELAFAAALAQPWAWRVLTGAVTTQQVRRGLGAERLGLPDDLADRTARLALEPADYWAARSRRAWA